jgi:Na+-driven multidrug efflux pump
MRGAGATGSVMRWSFGSMIFYRVFILWLWSRYGDLTLMGVWIVFSLDLATQAVIFTRLHFRGKWLEAHV